MGRAPRLNRGDVYTARLDPVEGSEQGGVRPVAIVSREIINRRASFVIAVPLTTYRGQRLLPSHTVVRAGDGGLENDSVALAEQVRTLSKTRFGRQRGTLSPGAMVRIEAALRSALALNTGP